MRNAKAIKPHYKWYNLHPHGKVMHAIDSVGAVAVIFTAVEVNPFEVAFLPSPTSWAEPMFIINRLVDLFFIFDMAIQFFLMYRKESSR